MVLLALPVVATVGGGITWLSGTYIVVLAVLMILGAGVQRRSWAIQFDVALQVAMIVGWVFHPAIGSLGILFAAVWAYILYLRRDIRQRLRDGLLPGQRD